VDSLQQAVANHQAGRLQEAAAAYTSLLAEQPGLIQALHNLGLIQLETGDLSAAEASLKRAVSIQPAFANGWNSLANVYQKQERWAEAIEAYQQALKLEPVAADTLYNLGIVYQKLGQYPQAIQAYEQAITSQPDGDLPYLNLGALYQELGDSDQAIAHYRQAIFLNPSNPLPMNNLGHCCYDQGHLEEARAWYAQALALDPANRLARFRYEALCPIFPDDAQSIHTYRARLHDALEQELAVWGSQPAGCLTLDQVVSAGCEPSFYLPYQGENDCALKTRYGQIFDQALRLRFPDLMMPPPSAPKTGLPRVGFLVTDRHEGIFCKLMAGLINRLSQDRFEWVIIGPEKGFQTLQQAITHPGVRYVPLGYEVVASIEVLRAEQLDVLFYFEVGTDALNYFLPFFRVAPVQCTAWGVPVTTGIPAMDYVLSSTLIEGDDADAHYSETLVLMNNLPVCFERPALPASPPSREALGLPSNQTVYLCPQNLFKLHPDFDAILAGILTQDPHGVVVLIEGRDPAWTQHIRSRFARTLGAVSDRVQFLPRLTNDQFLTVMAMADVMLDPVHYSGGTTSLEGLSFGTPIVTLPSPYARARLTLACYNAMGLSDCVVDTAEAYIQKAVQLGTDPAYREDIRQRILERCGVLYGIPAAVTELEQFFQWAIEQKRSEVLPDPGFTLCQAGRFADAVAYYESFPQLTSEQSLHLGHAQYHLGHYDAAIACYEAVLRHHPDALEPLIHRGNALLAADHLTAAEEAYQTILTLDPHQPAVWANLGLVYKRQHHWDKAITCYQTALSLDSTLPNGYSNLGNALKEAGQLQEALSAYQHAVSQHPESMEAHYNLALLLNQLNQAETALGHAQRACQLAPQSADSLCLLGSVSYRLGCLLDTQTAFETALEIAPDCFQAVYQLGVLSQQTGSPTQETADQAERYLRRAVALQPEHPEALFSLGHFLYDQGRWPEAMTVWERYRSVMPTLPLQREILLNTLCPIFPNDASEIAGIRDCLVQGLDHLLQRANAGTLPPLCPSGNLDDLIYSRAEPSFYLPYHGLNDRPIKAAFGQLYHRLLSQEFSDLMDGFPVKRSGQGRIRVGFWVSEHHEMIFWKLMNGYLEHLDRSRFELTLLGRSKSLQIVTQQLSASARETVQTVGLDGELNEIIPTVRRLALDIVWFDEVGTTSLNYFLPFFRLAPIQLTANGFPITTGIPTMDYFLSSQWMETEAAQDQYTETLICLPELPVTFQKPNGPLPPVSRSVLGLPETAHLYLCPQSLFKLHPEFDAILAGILTQDPAGRILLLEAPGKPHWSTIIRNRLARHLSPEALGRVVFLPRQSKSGYLALLAMADVILDPTAYNGSITTHEALAMGTPIVTWPGETFRGRFTAGCYRRMGWEEAIVSSSEAYIQLACELGTQPERRAAFHQAILDRHTVLFDNRAAVEAMATFFTQAVCQTKGGEAGW
jgi:predicted O-linked N-acetylglucosamine transferase (SPINDLY family)